MSIPPPWKAYGDEFKNYNAIRAFLNNDIEKIKEYDTLYSLYMKTSTDAASATDIEEYTTLFNTIHSRTHAARAAGRKKRRTRRIRRTRRKTLRSRLKSFI